MKPPCQMSRGGIGAVSIALALVTSACGGSSGTDSSDDINFATTTTTAAISPDTSTVASTPNATDQTTTAAPTTTVPEPTTTSTTPVVEFTSVVGAGGLVTLTLPDTWVFTPRVPEPLAVTIEPVDPFAERAYDFDGEQQNLLIEFNNGAVQAAIVSEPQTYTAPDYRTWRNLVLAAAEEDGFSRNIELTLEWGGGRGDRAVGRVDGDFAQVDTVEVGGIKVMALAVADGDPSDTDLDELREILASVEIHPDSIPLLTHVTEARRFVTEDGTGSTPFEVSYYVPGDWALTNAEESLYEPPDGDAFIQIFLELDTEGFERHIEIELANFANEYLEVEPIRTDFAEQVVPTVVFWNGTPGVADAAVVMAADGVVFMNTYLAAEPALLVEIVDSLVFLDSAFG